MSFTASDALFCFILFSRRGCNNESNSSGNTMATSAQGDFSPVCVPAAAELSWPHILMLNRFLSLEYFLPRPNKKLQPSQVRAWIENTLCLCLSLLLLSGRIAAVLKAISAAASSQRKDEVSEASGTLHFKLLHKWQNEFLFPARRPDRCVFPFPQGGIKPQLLILFKWAQTSVESEMCLLDMQLMSYVEIFISLMVSDQQDESLGWSHNDM